MVNANLVITLSVISVATLATLGAVYMAGGFGASSTMKDLCDEVKSYDGDEYADVLALCDAIDEDVGYNAVKLHETYPCTEDANGPSFSLDEIFGADDVAAAFAAVQDRCITTEEKEALASVEERRALSEWVPDGERELGFNLPGFGCCGTSNDNNYCHSKKCTKGDRGSHYLSKTCCVKHDKCLNSGCSSGKQCDKDLKKCADKRKANCPWNWWYCRSYHSMLRRVFKKTRNPGKCGNSC